MSLKSEWRLIDSGEGDAYANMAIDEAITFSVIKGGSPPTLRFYAWKVPSVSLGYFQRIDDIDIAYCLENNLPVVRRPTGGRAILHDDELTYSFASANTGVFDTGLRESYYLLGQCFFYAFQMLGLDVEMMNKRQRGSILTRSPLCFNSTSFGEITFKGFKLIGSAQRRWQKGFLQQGSIPFCIDEEMTKRIFKLPNDRFAEMKGLRNFIDIDRHKMKKAITHAFEEIFNVRLVLSHLSEDELLLAEDLLRGRYLRSEWNLSRSVELIMSDNRRG